MSRAILITVAIFAAIVGTLAHTAFGEDDVRPSSRRVQTQASAETKPAEFQPRESVTPVPAKNIETFVVKSSTVQADIAAGNRAGESSQFSTTTKRFIASSASEQQSQLDDTSQGLKWRTPARQHFQSQVAPASHEEEVDPRRPRRAPWAIEPTHADSKASHITGMVVPASHVQQAQASRFTDDPDAPATIPPLNEPDLSQPSNLDIDRSTQPPSALDDLLPPVLPELDPLPDPDAPPVDPIQEPGGGVIGGDVAKDPPCKEIYRDTDCCKQSAGCKAAWDAVGRNHVIKFPISFLDITPRYQPDLRPTIGRRKSEDEVRSKALATLEPRKWHNRAGQQVANGKFINYQWGRIIIQSRDGLITEVPLTDLGSDELCYVGAYWGDGVGLPDYCRIQGQYVIRDFTLTTFHWKASALCHKPLYFEEVQLERYGHSHGPLLQPIVSTGHFFVNIAILPYKMGINPPNECMYALGYYRPGNCAPYMIPPVPYSIRGGLYEAGAIVGGIAIFP